MKVSICFGERVAAKVGTVYANSPTRESDSERESTWTLKRPYRIFAYIYIIYYFMKAIQSQRLLRSMSNSQNSWDCVIRYLIQNMGKRLQKIRKRSFTKFWYRAQVSTGLFQYFLIYSLLGIQLWSSLSSCCRGINIISILSHHDVNWCQVSIGFANDKSLLENLIDHL